MGSKEEFLYVDVKTDEYCKSISRHMDNIANMHKKYLKNSQDALLRDELLLEKQKLAELVSAIKLLVEEAGIDKLSKVNTTILESLKKFNILSSDHSRFNEAMEKYVAAVVKRHEIDSSAAGRLWNNIKMGYYPSDEANVELIKKAITFPKVQCNILDPCCGCAKAIAQLAAGNEATTYGIELDEARAEEARRRLTRLGKGSYFGSRISHEAFHLMYLNPPYLTVYSEGNNVRAEKRFLIESLYHVMMGGLLVYVVPYYRITADIARILTDNFRDISIYKFAGPEFERFKQVAVFGLRKPKENGQKEVARLTEAVLFSEKIPSLTQIEEGRYRLPEKAVTVNIFKGAVFDVYELAEQLKNTGLVKQLFAENELDNTRKRPLIPFNIGQIGLIGGSGLIDGLIECDSPHILKGQVVKIRKEVDEKRNEKGLKTSITEQITNKMNLKILTQNGVITLS